MKLLQNKTNVEAPSIAWPFGNLKNDTGAGDGTPVDKELITDIQQTFEKIFDESGLTANGLPDNDTNGFQLYEALLGNVTKKYIKTFTSIFDGDIVTITRAEIESAFDGATPFYKGALGSGTSQNLFTDIHVKAMFLESGGTEWKDFDTSNTLGVKVNATTGDVILTFTGTPISPAATVRAIIIG